MKLKLIESRLAPEMTRKFDRFSGSLVVLQKKKSDILLELKLTNEREADIVVKNC